ncbi:hypothetical protein P7C71_g786, partial [Lecanoromycetidae sp. Uapishka_2]
MRKDTDSCGSHLLAMLAGTPHIAKTIADLKDLALRGLKPIRLYRSMHKEKELKRSKSEFIAKNDDEIFETDEIDREAVAEALLLPILENLKSDQRKKAFQHANYSVQARCIERAVEAESKGETCMAAYIPTNEERAQNPTAGLLELWIEALLNFSANYDVSMESLPSVYTASSMQGRETDFMIYDSVLSYVNGFGDLGIQQDKKLMNVVYTRPRYGSLTLYNGTILEGALVNEWKEKKDKSGRGIAEANPLPYLLHVVQTRVQDSHMYQKTAQSVKVTAVQEKAGLKKPEGMISLFAYADDQNLAREKTGRDVTPEEVYLMQYLGNNEEIAEVKLVFVSEGTPHAEGEDTVYVVAKDVADGLYPSVEPESAAPNPPTTNDWANSTGSAPSTGDDWANAAVSAPPTSQNDAGWS